MAHDRMPLNDWTQNFTSWQNPNAKNSTLVFYWLPPSPTETSTNTHTHNPTEKSWGNGRASPYKENKGTGRERGEDRGWWRGSTQCVEIGRPELVGGKASKAGAQPPHSPQLRGLWRQRTTASLFLSFSFPNQGPHCTRLPYLTPAKPSLPRTSLAGTMEAPDLHVPKVLKLHSSVFIQY